MKRRNLQRETQAPLVLVDFDHSSNRDPHRFSPRSGRAIAIRDKTYGHTESQRSVLNLGLLVIALLAMLLLGKRALANESVSLETTTNSETTANQETKVVLVSDFRDDRFTSAEVAKWSTLTDRARPDRRFTGSTADLIVGSGVALFQGELVLEDGAGFASIRRTPESGLWDVRDFDRVMIEVTGDRREYRVLLKDVTAQGQGYSYQATWSTNGKKEVMALPLNQFVPVRRGQIVSGSVGPLDLSKIVEVGIQLNDGQAGQFQLAIEGFWFEK